MSDIDILYIPYCTNRPPSMTESQYAILLHLKTHLKLEKTLGHEVFPTLRRSTRSSKSLQADLCEYICFFFCLSHYLLFFLVDHVQYAKNLIAKTSYPLIRKPPPHRKGMKSLSGSMSLGRHLASVLLILIAIILFVQELVK